MGFRSSGLMRGPKEMVDWDAAEAEDWDAEWVRGNERDRLREPMVVDGTATGGFGRMRSKVPLGSNKYAEGPNSDAVEEFMPATPPAPAFAATASEPFAVVPPAFAPATPTAVGETIELATFTAFLWKNPRT
jgi:hypothetical protein